MEHQTERESVIPAQAGLCQERHPEIPQTEIQRLALTLADAREWAERGKSTSGYAVLLRGLTHAERSLLEHRSWAPALLQCWRQAINGYCRQHTREEADE